MADREAVGEPSALIGGRLIATPRRQSQDENEVSSSTPMDIDEAVDNASIAGLMQSYQRSSPASLGQVDEVSSGGLQPGAPVTVHSPFPSSSTNVPRSSTDVPNISLSSSTNAPAADTTVISGVQHLPQTAMPVPSTSTPTHTPSPAHTTPSPTPSSSTVSAVAAATTSLLRETLQLIQTSASQSSSPATTTTAGSGKVTLHLPQTTISLMQNTAIAAGARDSHVGGTRESLLLPHTATPQPLIIPPAPPVHLGLQRSRSGQTPPPAALAITRENLTPTFTLPQTAVTPTMTPTPTSAPTTTRELQLPQSTAALQLPQTADLSALNVQASGGQQGAVGRQVLQLPKSDISTASLVSASSTARDTLHLPRTSAPPISDNSRLKLQLPHTSEMTTRNLTPPSQSGDVIRSLLQLPQTSLNPQTTQPTPAQFTLAHQPQTSLPPHTSLVSQMVQSSVVQSPIPTQPQPSLVSQLVQSSIIQSPAVQTHSTQPSVNISILGQSTLPAIALIKKELVQPSNTVTDFSHASVVDTNPHHHQAMVVNAPESSVSVQVHIPDHLAAAVAYPQGDGSALQVSTTVAGMAITKTEDGGRMMVAYGEDGTPLSTARVDDLAAAAQYVGTVRLPHAGDVGRVDVAYADMGNANTAAYDGSGYSGDGREVQYEDPSRVQVAYMEDGTRVHLVVEQQGDTLVQVAYTEDGRRINVPYTIETVPQHELDRVASGHNRRTEEMTKMGAVEVGLSQQQQLGNVSGAVVSQQGDLAHYAPAYSEADLRMSLARGEISLSQGDARIVLPQMEIKSSGSSMHLSGGAEVKQSLSGLALNSGVSMNISVGHAVDMSPTTLPQTGIIDATTISPADYARMSAAPQYHESPTLLPQTSNIQAMNLSQTNITSATRSPNLAQPSRMPTTQPPPADDINMRMMAAAAEIMSQSSRSVDDVNMRLMAETADYISRSAQQHASSNASTSRDISARVLSQRGAPAPAAISLPRSQLQLPANSVASSPFMANQVEGSVAASGDRQQPVMSISIGPTPMKKEHPEEIVRGFRDEFCKSASFARWKQIGKTRALKSDEEIACYLMKYYDATIGLFPDNSPTCLVCNRDISVACLYCMKRAAGEDTDTEGAEDGEMEVSAMEDPRSKLWKIIVAASANKKAEKEKDGSTDKQTSRRKPAATTRRMVVQSDFDDFDDDDDDDDDIADTDDASLDNSVHFASEGDKKFFTPGVRKRGRPSNDSYKSGDTLSCGGCGKKFHTVIGLDKHRKLKKCKGLDFMSDDEESSSKSTPSFGKFECVDCKKRYRSKQGLVLHRVSKHPEASDVSQFGVSDGDETDDYTSTTPASTPASTPTTPRTPMSFKRDRSGLFPCDICTKKYRSKQGLMLHMVSKHKEKKMREEDTKVKVEPGDHDDADMKPDMSGMVTRSRGSSGSNAKYECTTCHRKYNSRPGLMLHIKSKHAPQVMLDCPTCKQQFKTKLELRIHIRKEHSDGRLLLFCPYCPQTFQNRQILKEHMSDKHKTCRQTLYDCFGCDLQFSSRIERKRHIQSEHKGKDTSLTCKFCGQWFATRMEFAQHEHVGHEDQKQAWLCATCGDAFPTKYLLQRHTLTHKEKIDCELCGKSITEPCYDDHMKRHFGNKSWKCQVCPKSFIRKAELQQHMLVHKDERPFCCELCGVRYREKSRLNSHMRTHSGIKPYKCDQCEKAFTRSRELKNHFRVHTGERPFSCAVCGRKFASSGNLSAHRRKVHKLSPIPHGMQSRRHMLEERTRPGQPQQIVTQPLLESVLNAEGDPGVAGNHQDAHTSHPTTTTTLPPAHQAPAAHQQTLASHSDIASAAAAAVALVYQQEGAVLPKYEPVMSQSDQYIPQHAVITQQSVIQQVPVTSQQQDDEQQQEQSVPIYWPNASYGESQ